MKLPNNSQSLWLATSKGRGFPALRTDLAVDVAIVGAGITGLTAASLLKKAGLSVAVIEADGVAEGASGLTTAHVTEAFDGNCGQLIKDLGEDNASLAAESGRVALSRIAGFVREEGIDCDFARVPAFRYTEDAETVSELEAERKAAASLGSKVALTREVPLPFKVAGALRFDGQAQFHPRRGLVSPGLSELGRRAAERGEVNGALEARHSDLRRRRSARLRRALRSLFADAAHTRARLAALGGQRAVSCIHRRQYGG